MEALAPVEREAWRDEIPSDAEVGACSQDHRYTSDTQESNSTEVCGTPYTVDTGTGLGEVVQDCVYEVYDDRCTYTVMDWAVFDTVTLAGTDLNLSWPEVSLTDDQRQGDPTEEFTCDVLFRWGYVFVYRRQRQRIQSVSSQAAPGS